MLGSPSRSNTDFVPLSPEQKAEGAASFGDVASHYARFRPGAPAAAVDWILPGRAPTVIDLGAGTGALSRLLIDRADEVVAVEPDDLMRAVLAETVPQAQAVAGRGESIALPDASADAVIASSSWHWMDPVPTPNEVGRVLVPGGTLGALWSGPDRDSPFLAQAQALMRGEGRPMLDQEAAAALSQAVNDPYTVTQGLEIPLGVPFDQPERRVISQDVALNAEELIRLLGTFS